MNSESKENTTHKIILGDFTLRVKRKSKGLFAQLKYKRFLIQEKEIDSSDNHTKSPQYQQLLNDAIEYVRAGWKPSQKLFDPQFASEKSVDQPVITE